MVGGRQIPGTAIRSTQRIEFTALGHGMRFLARAALRRPVSSEQAITERY
jgi:hypothetical protein